jgi:O-methyltransferase
LPDLADLYLDLLKRSLTRTIGNRYELAAPPTRWKALAFLPAQRWLARRGYALVRESPPGVREEGRDLPADAETMIGLARLNQLDDAVRTVVRENIPGDLLEAGVWRGGAGILMRAALNAVGDERRTVWLADSFQGLPKPDAERYPADAGDVHSKFPELAVARKDVEDNFRQYGLLDRRVRFLEGWFEDTLPGPVEQLAILRLDGDLYSSTIVTFERLYNRVSVGGFVIVDDYGAVRKARQATDDFRADRGITVPLERIDWAGVYWRKPPD